MSTTRISVFGLGYVGAVSASCLAGRGHEVIAVDVAAEKVNELNDGEPPVAEPGLDELVAEGVGSGRLRATTDESEAVGGTELSFVCVGTPSLDTGAVDTTAVERVAEVIGRAIRGGERHLVVFRSTMPPGTCEEKLIPALEAASGGRVGRDFDVCMNPEFLREGSGVEDFNTPTKTVIGAASPEAAAPLVELYQDIPGPVNLVPLRVAEFIKYVENSWHALKIAFANEVGAVSEELGMDSHQVMDLFLQDTKLNVSAAYLRPGFAFGGSCLPKDVRGLRRLASLEAVDVPVIEHIMASNQAHLDRALKLVTSSQGRRVGLFGLSFKRGTDDLRESPYVTLAEQLVGKGYELRIYDPYVSLQRVIGQNRRYIEQHLPHLGKLVVESPQEAADVDICVLGMNDLPVIEAVARSSAGAVIDLVKVDGAGERFGRRRYRGLCW